MEQFYARRFFLEAIYLKDIVSTIGDEEHNNLVSDETKELWKGCLTALAEACKNAGLEDSNDHLKSLKTDFEIWERDKTYRDILNTAKEIERVITRDLGKTLFVRIPQDHAEYYQKEELFGGKVKEKFPQANKEITEAGNCYAAGNYTACVFHLMRAVEHGARALVKQLGVAKNLPHPVELCDWGTLFRELNSAVKALPPRKSVAASETFAFYNYAVAQFGNFKDAWRNKVSHTRVSYRPNQAKDIMNNTRQFMEHLAERLRWRRE